MPSPARGTASLMTPPRRRSARMPSGRAAKPLELMETTINDVRAGRLDVRVANAIGYLANVSVKVIQQTDIEARLEALESVLEPEHATMVQRRRAA